MHVGGLAGAYHKPCVVVRRGCGDHAVVEEMASGEARLLVEKADVIGEPKNYDAGNPIPQNRPGQPSGPNQHGLSIDNVQHHGGSRASGPDAGQHAFGGSSFPRQESVMNNQSYSGSFAAGSLPGRNTSNSNHLPAKADPASGSFMESNQSGGLQPKRFPGSSGGGFQPPGNSYVRPAQPAFQQPAPMYTNRGPIAKNEAPARIIPIAALNPYQGKWTIKARVTAKGDIRHYNNARGEGKVFSFDLLDSDGGEIRATCFNNVADQFYDQIEPGGIYLISKGSLRPSQKSFNHLNNEYEIMLESTSTIQPCSEEDNSIPRQQFSFRAISEIESMENNSMVDLVGIVTSINPAAGRVSDFSGKSVGTISSSQLLIEPDIPQAHQIREWYDREGKNHSTLSISREATIMGKMEVRKVVSQIKDEGLGRSEKPDWITVKATISFMKVDNFCYTACPLMVVDRQCSKKVNNNGDGTWHCDRCNQSFPECDYRYILQFQIQDHTGVTWVTAFQECGEEILGVPAKELYFLKYEEQDELKFAEVVRKVLFSQYLFKLKVKEETFSDEQRVKSTCIKSERVNPSSESKFLLSMIERLPREDANAAPVMNVSYASAAGINNTPVGGGFDRYRMDSSSQGCQYDSFSRSREVPFCNNCGRTPAGRDSQHQCDRVAEQGCVVTRQSNKKPRSGLTENTDHTRAPHSATYALACASTKSLACVHAHTYRQRTGARTRSPASIGNHTRCRVRSGDMIPRLCGVLRPIAARALARGATRPHDMQAYSHPRGAHASACCARSSLSRHLTVKSARAVQIRVVNK
ncbi:hypothetical protein KSP39_PZI021782 [Platanthera zijinensis]|uniref:Replication protein A subunit n=1 Tax=Platanthera zijinensis TaxID=2320716 RepID=A0AAP0AYJ1_9ASPA